MNRGPQNRPKHIIVLIIGATKMGPLILETAKYHLIETRSPLHSGTLGDAGRVPPVISPPPAWLARPDLVAGVANEGLNNPEGPFRLPIWNLSPKTTPYMVFWDLIPYWQSKWTLWVISKVTELFYRTLYLVLLLYPNYIGEPYTQGLGLGSCKWSWNQFCGQMRVLAGLGGLV